MRFVIDGRLRGPIMTGAGRYLAGLVPALAECAPQDEFVILARKGYAGLWGDVPANVHIKEVDVPPAGLKQHLVMRRIMKEITPDVFHYPMFDLPHELNVPSVITIFDLNAVLFPRYFTRGRWWRRPAAVLLYVSGIFRADYVLTSTQITCDELGRIVPFARKKITAIRLGYNHDPQMESGANIEEIERKYSLPENYFLYVGVHRPHKNLESLIRSMKMFNKGNALTLVVVGDLDDRFPDPRREVTRLRLEEVVKFIGYVPEKELGALYGGAVGLVFPSFQEGFGFPMLEAMDLGTAVACSDIPVHREVAGDAAIYFNPHSSQDIANALQKLLNDGNLRHLLVERGKKRIKLYQWKDCAAATLEVYRNVALKNKRR